MFGINVSVFFYLGVFLIVIAFLVLAIGRLMRPTLSTKNAKAKVPFFQDDDELERAC